MGLRLVVDATEPRAVEDFLQDMILADNRRGSELLSRLMITRGVVSIVNGENPRQIAFRLTAMLGEGYMKRLEDDKEFLFPGKKAIDAFMESIKDMKALPECEEFEAFMFSLANDMSWRRIIVDCDMKDIANAFCGCSYAVVKKLSESMSARNFLEHIEAWKEPRNWDIMRAYGNKGILQAQEKVMAKAHELEKRGEIRFNKA